MALTGEESGTILPTAVEQSVISADSLVSDSAEADSVAAGEMHGEELMGIVLESDPYDEPMPGHLGEGMSWVFMVLVLGFCLVALRFRNSPGYLKAMVSDLTDTRTRTNLFDNTVRETSILVLMNVMWVGCMGVLLWQGLSEIPSPPWYSYSVPDRPALGIAVCTACVAIYYLLMLLAYWVVGNVFTDARRTVLWVKGSAASTGLETIILFPVAMLALVQPGWVHNLLIVAAVIFAIGKCVFLFKGFRIFFTQFSSWLLFLYYLCSLEIVPLVLLYWSTVYALGVLL